MDRQSIINDLKKYAGRTIINAQKITENISNDPSTRTYDINAIQDKIIPPFIAILQDGILSPDNATVNIQCGLGHIHKHFIVDLINNILECYTCKHSTKFVSLVREIVGSILKDPLILLHTPVRTGNYTIINNKYMVSIKCAKVGELTGPPEILDGRLFIYLPYSTSRKKVYKNIIDSLRMQKTWFPNDIQDRIAITRESNNINTFLKDPLPYTNELANEVLKERQIHNTFLGLMTMNILDTNALYIENCKIKLN